MTILPESCLRDQAEGDLIVAIQDNYGTDLSTAIKIYLEHPELKEHILNDDIDILTDPSYLQELAEQIR